jgi:hypothetical protein
MTSRSKSALAPSLLGPSPNLPAERPPRERRRVESIDIFGVPAPEETGRLWPAGRQVTALRAFITLHWSIMMVRTWLAPIFILLLFGGTTACQQGSGDDECIAGAVGCSCTELGECLGGLQCLSNFCVDPSSPTSATANPSGSNTDATGSEPTSEPTTSDATSSDMTNPTAGESTSAPAGCMDPRGGGDNNSPCTDPSGCGCASGHCALVPGFGGWCGECTEDAHCPDAGRVHPCRTRSRSSGAAAPPASTREMAVRRTTPAMTSSSRAAPRSSRPPGGTVVRGCSECVTDDDCSGDNTCHPRRSVTSIGRVPAMWRPASARPVRQFQSMRRLLLVLRQAACAQRSRAQRV